MAADRGLVVVGAHGWDGGWNPEHSLVIDANADALAAVATSGASVREAVLGRRDGDTLRWHRFNDGRCDGLLDLEAYRHLFPNLALQQAESRSSCTLASVLEQQGGCWAGEMPLVLWLEQGDGLATLVGAESVLERVEEIAMGSILAALPGSEHLDGWLAGQGFRRSAEGRSSWQRDPLLQQLQQERQALRARVAELEAAMGSINAEFQQLLQERQALRARVAELEAAMGSINAEVDELLKVLETS